MTDKCYFCESAEKNVVITKSVIRTGGTVSMGIHVSVKRGIRKAQGWSFASALVC